MREGWAVSWRMTVVAAIGPAILAERGIGESALGDLPLLVGGLLLSTFLLTVIARTTLRRVALDRFMAVALVVSAALCLPLVFAGPLAGSVPVLGAVRLRHVMLGVALVITLALVVFGRRARPPARFVSMATSIALTILLWALGRVGLAEASMRRAVSRSPTLAALREWDADSAARTVRPGARPDVFLFILDSYAGDSLLRADYGVDHRPYRDSLTALGFQATAPYRSNYTRTFASLASLLNFAQVAPVSREALAPVQHAGALQSVITDNRAVRFFSAAGYSIHWFPAPFFGGHALPPKVAEVHRPPGSRVWQRWVSSLLLATWFERAFVPGAIAAAVGIRVPVAPAHYGALPDLLTLATDGRPTFAIVHLFATHEPLVYDASCRHEPTAGDRLGTRAAYAAAVRCQDAELLRLFATLVRQAGPDLVIAVVGDHAPAALGFAETTVPPEAVPREVALSRVDVGARFFVPPERRAGFAAPSSGVAVVPALMRAALGAAPGLAPDSVYYSHPRPYPIHRFHAIAP